MKSPSPEASAETAPKNTMRPFPITKPIAQAITVTWPRTASIRGSGQVKRAGIGSGRVTTSPAGDRHFPGAGDGGRPTTHRRSARDCLPTGRNPGRFARTPIANPASQPRADHHEHLEALKPSERFSSDRSR